jgi:DASH complex subunit DAM1
MPGPTPHRTPLRRLSQGSLFALSRSGAFPDAPHGLGFIEPAIAELLDETEALHANIDGMRNLSESLASFNESFASWLYVLNMNALTTDWPQVSGRLTKLVVLNRTVCQAPTDASFEIARRRAGSFLLLISL